ncbi:hypothetical protein ACWDWS_04545 [Streptomyces sp. NPDC003328]
MVHVYLRQLDDELPSSRIQRNAIIWHAVNAALDAFDATSAADEDTQRAARRDSLRNLLGRLERGAFDPLGDQAVLLGHHVEAEIHEADTARHNAEQTEELLRTAHDTSNTSETARAAAVQRADQLRATLDEILRQLVHKGHPGEPCLQTGWVSVRTVDRWRAALASSEQP